MQSYDVIKNGLAPATAMDVYDRDPGEHRKWTDQFVYETIPSGNP